MDFGEEKKAGRSLISDDNAAFAQPPEDGALMASYSVFVLEPGASIGKAIISDRHDGPVLQSNCNSSFQTILKRAVSFPLGLLDLRGCFTSVLCSAPASSSRLSSASSSARPWPARAPGSIVLKKRRTPSLKSLTPTPGPGTDRSMALGEFVSQCTSCTHHSRALRGTFAFARSLINSSAHRASCAPILTSPGNFSAQFPSSPMPQSMSYLLSMAA